MKYKSVFKMPVPMKITGRSSSITNSFVNSIIPVVTPTNDDIKEALEILGMDQNTIECCYCGLKHTEWDHLRPLVLDKMPTGYISEIQNLVPSCSKCNQSKRNTEWEIWIKSDAPLSPKTKGVKDLSCRINKLQNYANWRIPTKVNFKDKIGDELWVKHWDNCTQIQNLLINAQKNSEAIKDSLNGVVVQPLASENIINKAISANSIKIGKVVQNYIVAILNLGSKEIERLESKEYSKNTFDINFPFLSEVTENSSKKERYWKKIYKVNGKFYVVTSEWYDKNNKKFISYLKSKLLM